MEHEGQARTASIINILAGIWLIISPGVLGFSNSAVQTNNVWLGFIVGVLALIRAIVPEARTMWLSWINILAGIWLIISPFALGFTSTAQRTNDIILGIIVGVLAIWSSGATLTSHSTTTRHAHA